jgi:uncharacterized protein with HEPN domain
MQPRDRASLLDLVAAGDAIIARCGGKSFEDLVTDDALADGILYRFAILGEAARRLSDPSLFQLEGLTWSSVISMRNRVLHAYDEVDFSIVWSTIETSLPALLAQVRDLLDGDDPPGAPAPA